MDARRRLKASKGKAPGTSVNEAGADREELDNFLVDISHMYEVLGLMDLVPVNG